MSLHWALQVQVVVVTNSSSLRTQGPKRSTKVSHRRVSRSQKLCVHLLRLDLNGNSFFVLTPGICDKSFFSNPYRAFNRIFLGRNFQKVTEKSYTVRRAIYTEE
jgi:hypothetical protein